MRPLIFTAVCASALLLGACATMAPYGPATGPRSQGFSEQAIETNRYRVIYRGQGPAAQVADYALRRAAELALERGYDWFSVEQRWVEQGWDGSGPRVSIGGGSSSYGRYRSSGVGVGIGFTFGDQQPSTAVLEARFGRGPRPDRPEAYDAREVVASIR